MLVASTLLRSVGVTVATMASAKEPLPSSSVPCGAVQATLEELARPSADQSQNLIAIVDRIRPAVEGLLQTPLASDPHQLLHHATRNNVRMATNHLRHGSRVLEQLIQNDGLLVVGAEYSLETGVVEFFDGVPK